MNNEIINKEDLLCFFSIITLTIAFLMIPAGILFAIATFDLNWLWMSLAGFVFLV